MRISVSYIDHTMASLAAREVFSFSKSSIVEISRFLKSFDSIEGVVILSTCNRTEIYLSYGEGETIEPFKEITKWKGMDDSELLSSIVLKEQRDAMDHLCRVVSGIESQLWGDAQIISQVRLAWDWSRENQCSDVFLNVVFQKAIEGGKKVRTNVRFTIHNDSTADKAVEILKEKQVKSVLVIGNGEIGRLVARKLVQNDVSTTMTIRQYHKGIVLVPEGAESIMYSERYKIMDQVDGIVSATASPHYTLTYEEFETCKKIPSIMIDMAVPRDVDPKIEELGAHIYNIDDISQGTKEVLQEDQIRQVEEYFQESMDKIEEWESYRNQFSGKVIGISKENWEKEKISKFSFDRILGEESLYSEVPENLTWKFRSFMGNSMDLEFERAFRWACKGKSVLFILPNVWEESWAQWVDRYKKIRPDISWKREGKKI